MEKQVKEFSFHGENIPAKNLARALIEVTGIKEEVKILHKNNSCQVIRNNERGRPFAIGFSLDATYDSKEDKTIVYIKEGDYSISENILRNVKDYVKEFY